MPPTKFKPPQVDAEAVVDKDPSELEDHEIRWLQDHDMRPEGVDPVPVFYYLEDGSKVSNDPAFFAMEQANNPSFMKDVVEARAQELADRMVAERMAEMNIQAGQQGVYHGNALNQPAVTADTALNAYAEESDEDVEYSERTVKELRAEIYRRNEGREDDAKISMEGHKDDLVAALEADDEA